MSEDLDAVVDLAVQRYRAEHAGEYSHEPGHDALCAWPHRPCAVACGAAVAPTSPKFSSALAERLWTLSLESVQDDELGEAETFGWFALFERDRAILVVNSQGLVSCSDHLTAEDARAIWRGIEAEYERFTVQGIIEVLNTSECDDLFLIIDTARHAGRLPTRDEIAAHVYGHAECRTRNAWALD